MNTIAEIEKLNAMFFGLAGSGKTTLAYSAILDTRLTPCLALDFAGNPQSVAFRSYPDLDVRRLSNITEIHEVISELMANKNIAKILPRPATEYKCVIIDTLSHVSRLGMFKKFSIDLGNIAEISEEENRKAMKNHGDILNWITELTWRITNKIPQHVIVTAQEYSDDFGITKRATKTPAFSGRAVNEVTSYFNIVARTLHKVSWSEQTITAMKKIDTQFKGENSSIKAIAQFEPSTSVTIAKKQYFGNTIPDYMINPTLTRILDSIPVFKGK